MTKDELINEYFEWMVKKTCGNKCSQERAYRKLLRHLHKIEFTYTIDMDENREQDGIDLRYRFGYELEYPDAMIASYLDDGPCSVLEMMVALAMRCEENIMDNPEIGDRLGQWFWNMIASLRLWSMTDERFNVEYVDNAIAKFLYREYDRNGVGGLFTLERPRRDLRSVEIWYQMCWYLDEIM